jgi:isopentenyl diphosphate isomerase/L-lactate dehydrogenase-like FMN-dependent dehydrogenase
VLIGRPQIYGLIVDGQQGVTSVIEILRGELDRALTLMGVGCVSQLDRSWLIPSGTAYIQPDRETRKRGRLPWAGAH